MVEQIKLQQIEIAILTLPAQQAQQVVDQLADIIMMQEIN
jgi:redox-sensing transcriptional repressor